MTRRIYSLDVGLTGTVLDTRDGLARVQWEDGLISWEDLAELWDVADEPPRP